MQVTLLDIPDGNVVARGSYFGGPDYEFFVAADGQIRFRVVGDTESVWAGPDADAFRRIASAWNRYRDDVRRLHNERERLERVRFMRSELSELGALPSGPELEPLWAILVFEAENGLS